MEVYIAKHKFSTFFAPDFDLDLDPMTFIYAQIHIWTWPVLLGDTPKVQIWTSYVKAF